jgi:hypothetical protein
LRCQKDATTQAASSDLSISFNSPRGALVPIILAGGYTVEAFRRMVAGWIAWAATTTAIHSNIIQEIRLVN